MASASSRPMLTQLSGLRAGLGLWIVLDHFMGEPRMFDALVRAAVRSARASPYQASARLSPSDRQ